MPDEDFINLEDTVQTHEAELDRQTKEIAALKDDLKLVLECNPGLLNLINLRSDHLLRKSTR